jgi:dipeptidase D
MDGKTREILDIFEKISSIPRCSKHEEKISQWLEQWAADKGFAVRKDSTKNMVIKVSATPGVDNAPGIVIQGHMDMVCEKTDDSEHDFSTDPIRFVYDKEWLKADKTTLGADNGIGLAFGMALAVDPKVIHPPLELVFTVDEESGLRGAEAMTNDFIEGKVLLNVDSEEEGIFTVGCAGGVDTHISLALDYEHIPEDYNIYKISAFGMHGGHSGIDIHKHRASANKILARVLHFIKQPIDFRIISIKGGTTHNAIAREAEATVTFTPQHFSKAQDIISEFEETVHNEYAQAEATLALSLNQVQSKRVHGSALSPTASDKVIQLLLAIPHGVAGMSADIGDLVETSNNLATVEIKNQTLQILTSQRSSVMSRLTEITSQVEAAAALAGAVFKNENSYPAWQPNMTSPLLKHCKEVYKDIFGADPEVQSIHAGLECGIIGSKHKGMDMISFGPTIEDPHSPDEKLYVPSIKRVWDFMVALLQSYTQ